MIKLLKNILISFYLILFFTTSVYSKDLSTLLRTQQLTVFDIGIFRLEEDLKSSYPAVKKHKDVLMKIYIWMLSVPIGEIQ